MVSAMFSNTRMMSISRISFSTPVAFRSSSTSAMTAGDATGPIKGLSAAHPLMF